MSIHSPEVAALHAELDQISKRNVITEKDKLRHKTLLAQIADANRRVRVEVRTGPRAPSSKEFRASVVKGYQEIARGEEIRAVQEAGQGIIVYGNGSGSTFVPTGFMYSGLQNALKTHSPLFDDDKVTFVTTKTGAGIQVPLTDDTSEAATVVAEAASDTDYENIGNATQIMNNVFMYRTPKVKTTIEFGEDALANLAVDFIENFFTERIARGVGADLILGNGTGRPLGLIPSLEANNVPYVTAAGSAENTGGTETGANSIGSRDLQNLYHSVDRQYRNSPKAAWLMADTTLLSIAALLDKFGSQLDLIKYVNGQPTLFGKPVYTDNSISHISVSQPTVVFGDLSRWLTRYVPSASYVQVYTELPGFAEAGLIGWSAFGRFGGCLLSKASTQTPINYLQQHS